MKILIINLLFLSYTNTFAGVGGSAGGDVNIKSNNIESLEYYLPRYKIDIPQINFEIPESEPVNLGVNEVCIRNDEVIESINEIEYNHLDQNKKIDFKIKEIIKRDRKFMNEIFIPHLFKKGETIIKEDLIPKSYDIKIMQPSSHADHLIHIVHYTIKDCE